MLTTKRITRPFSRSRFIAFSAVQMSANVFNLLCVQVDCVPAHLDCMLAPVQGIMVDYFSKRNSKLARSSLGCGRLFVLPSLRRRTQPEVCVITGSGFPAKAVSLQGAAKEPCRDLLFGED